MIYAILIIYIAFTFWGSLFGSKIKDATPESYFLADRNLKTLSLFFTILATNYSAFYFLGFAGEGYKIGYAHYTIMAVGTALAGINILILGIPTWRLGKKHGYITPSELIYGQTGSRSLSSLVSSVMILFTLPYLSLQIIGGGYILERLTDGDISYSLAIILLTIFTIVYVIIGGMQSVAKTDLKQGLLFLFFMVIGVLLISNEFGGVASANKTAYELNPDLFSAAGVGEHYSPQKWFSFIVFWSFCVPMFPQLFMRYYIAQDIGHLKNSAILYALAPLFISILPVMIGVWGHLSFSGLDAQTADQIFPMMLKEHTSDWFSALVMTGAIAAFMSTLDSQLLALSTMITRDFYIPFGKVKMSFKREVFIGRVLVGVLAIIGLLIAFKPFDTIFDIGKMAFSGIAILFPVGLIVTRSYLVRPRFLISGIIVGLLLLFGFYYEWIPKRWTFGFEYFIIIILVTSLISIGGIVGKVKS